MKSSVKLLFVFGIIFALIIGLFVGLSFKIGKVSEIEISGTIAKINNYRKAQNSITGIEIKNQLLSDTVRLKYMQNYLRFYYTTGVKMAGDIRFSIDEANAVEPFKNANNKEIADLVRYEKTFALVRTDLLLALRACLYPEKTDPLLLSEFINQASNDIAQMNFQNRTVLDFIDILALYIEKNKAVTLAGLARAHDLLMYNELNYSLLTQDKVVLKSFDKKDFFSDDKNQSLIDTKSMKEIIKLDFEKLSIMDDEIPGLKDFEKLKMKDVEKAGADDTEKLGFLTSEKLRAFDSDKPGRINHDLEGFGILIRF